MIWSWPALPRGSKTPSGEVNKARRPSDLHRFERWDDLSAYSEQEPAAPTTKAATAILLRTTRPAPLGTTSPVTEEHHPKAAVTRPGRAARLTRLDRRQRDRVPWGRKASERNRPTRRSSVRACGGKQVVRNAFPGNARSRFAEGTSRCRSRW